MSSTPPEVLDRVLLEHAELLLLQADIDAGVDPAHAVRRWCGDPHPVPLGGPHS